MKAETNSNPLSVATFGGGCFWCMEAVYQQLTGVVSVASGYMGGKVKNPTYNQVCSGDTGHAEVIQIRFDPARISYRQLLEWFWKSHDPTQLNRQGADVGTQYRSVVFYHADEQKQQAEETRTALNDAKTFGGPIVTEIVQAADFYKAEDYHQDYYRLNGRAPYCQFVIKPKLKKLGLKADPPPSPKQ